MTTQLIMDSTNWPTKHEKISWKKRPIPFLDQNNYGQSNSVQLSVQLSTTFRDIEDTNLDSLRGVQPNFFGKPDFEIAVGPLGPPSGPTFGGVFEVPDPYAPALCHAQISAPKIAISQSWSKPGLWVLYG